MALKDFDTSRAELEQKLDVLGDQLFTLEQDPTVTTLASLRLRGESAKRWADAQDTITRLWLSYAQLRERLTEASAARDSAQAMALLTDTPLSTPLIPEGARVADLLDVMTRAHDKAALIVSAIALTWDLCMPRLRIAEAEIDRLTAEASSLGLSGVVSFPLRDELAELSESVVDDPLSVTIERLDALEGHIEGCRDRLAAIFALRARWPEALTRARETFERVLSLAADAARAGDAARAKVFDARVTGLDVENDLGDGLHVIEDLARSELWIQTHHALVAWHACAEELEQRHRDALSENLRPLERRRELRGRLSAYRAKSAALSLAEDPHLEVLFREAQAALADRPTHLHRTEELIERYRAAIVASQARRVS